MHDFPKEFAKIIANDLFQDATENCVMLSTMATRKNGHSLHDKYNETLPKQNFLKNETNENQGP